MQPRRNSRAGMALIQTAQTVWIGSTEAVGSLRSATIDFKLKP
jgi:hypothetical protein